ncbi:hypothetical protein HK101_002918 [Irineochytrium annulatum]|nr:hypothetical protein HK101_002918 [Irineochytrium annulatum]
MPWLRHAVRWADRLRAPGFGGDPGCGEEEPPRVVLGSCTHGVTRVAPFVIRHVGLGFTALGDPFEGCRTEEGRRVLRERLWDHIGEGPDGRCAKDTANGCVIECFSARDGGLERFKRSLLLKLVVNAGLNPLTALSGGRNGQVVDSPHGRALVASACEEIAQILEKELGMSGEAMAKAVEDVAMRTRGNRNSMEVDVTAGRETEVDFILGYLIDMASDSSATARLGMLRDLIKLRVECQR